MNKLYAFLCCTFLTLYGHSAYSQASGISDQQPASATLEASSSSTEGTAQTSSDATLPEAPRPAVRSSRNDRYRMNILYQQHMRPFSHYAIAAKVGLEGIGVDVATPLSNKWNLRAGASFLGGAFNVHATDQTSNGFGAQIAGSDIDVNVRPRFKTAFAGLDWYPWFGSFRISPGITLYNDTRGSAVATVAGGSTISIGNDDYVSDPNNPIQALINVKMGHKIAPRLTVGWGNMIPRSGKHFSFPFEVGFQYVGKPTLTLSLTGNSCDSDGNCGSVNSDADTLADVRQEEKDLNDDIAPLRFYPIISQGISYRF